MKIGILTFHNAHNYGAVLQVYALKKQIEKIGHNVEVINYHHSNILADYPKNKIIKQGLKIDKTKKISNLIRNVYSNKFYRNRWNKFDTFIRYNITNNEPIYTIEEIQKLNFDTYICGSDQIWNPDITGGDLSQEFFLYFDTTAKKISYGASMGRKELPSHLENKFKKYIDGIHHVSVREEELKNYAQKLTNKDIKVVLDPTMLLHKEEYDKIATHKLYEKYLLIFSLVEDELLTEVAKTIANKLNLNIIEVNDRKKMNYFCEQVSDASPNDFISLIKNAEFVITNSFHATVFSILYEKKFYTIARKSGNNERMRNLLSMIGEEDRLIDDKQKINFNEEINYKEVKEKIEIKRKESIEFLEKTLNGE